MKRRAWKYIAVLAGAGLVGALAIAARSGRGDRRSEADTDRPEAAAWADPAAAERGVELDAEVRAVVSRVAEKEALADALIRRERTFADVAARFRELNAGAVDPDPADDAPSAEPEEAAYRQVAQFLRGRAHADPGRTAAVLRELEAEIARRFPSAAPAPAP